MKLQEQEEDFEQENEEEQDCILSPLARFNNKFTANFEYYWAVDHNKYIKLYFLSLKLCKLSDINETSLSENVYVNM